MGMVGRIAGRWSELNRKYVTSNRQASDVAGGLGAMSKVLRMLLQSAILAVGAYLVINQQSTAGIIIAGSILGARALAPVDLAIANWRGFVGARQAGSGCRGSSACCRRHQLPMPLKPPSGGMVVQNAAVAPPGENKIVCQDVNFSLEAGKAVGVIGPTASGKSSLARMLVGVWAPARGTVRLDGATIDQWSPEALGRHIGYLPQDVELFAGTVAQNIARFEEPARSGGRRRGGAGGRRPRSDHQPARRLRHPGRRPRRRAVGRPGPARRAGPRALSRSVPGRARRAQLQSRCRRRRGADAGHPGRARTRRHRRRGRAPAERDRRRRLHSRHGQGPPAAVRTERGNPQQGACKGRRRRHAR